MTKFAAISFAALALMLAPTHVRANAESDQSEFLGNFVGTFSGKGTLERGGGNHNINCSVTGTRTSDNAIDIKGKCSVLIFSSGVDARIRYDPQSGTYGGLWQDKNSTSDLSGRRSGNTLTLDIKRRGGATKAGAAGKMVVRSLGQDRYQLTVSTEGEAEQPQRVAVTLNRS